MFWRFHFTVVACLLPCSWGAAEDWPKYLKDNTRVGVTGEVLKFPLQLQFKPDLKPKLLARGTFEANSDDSLILQNVRAPWLYSSQGRGLTRSELHLLGKNDVAAESRVKLHFAELQMDTKPSDRVFDVKLQGKLVAPGLDVVVAASGVERALTREFRSVVVADNLLIELDPKKSEPILSAIEVERE